MTAPRFQFLKLNRLQTPADFKAVFANPIRSKTAYFTVLACPNNREHARLGAIVAKRYIRKATYRNVAKRLIRESFRQNKQRLAGLDVVVLVRCELPRHKNRVGYACLEQQWQSLVEQWNKG